MKKTFNLFFLALLPLMAHAQWEDISIPDAPPIKTQQELNPIIQNLINNMVGVEGGTFTMGATSEQKYDADDNEKPAHQVTVASFSIGKFEVTQEEWLTVMGSNPSKSKGSNLPVENVCWNDCQLFIKKLNAITGKHFRLPTESEWEFAARGGIKSNGYKYAGSNMIDSVAWYHENSKRMTHEVGQKSPNELGLYDMSGNVHEWCNNGFGDYKFSSQQNPAGLPDNAYRVARGGSYYDRKELLRVSCRGGDSPDSCRTTIGFRLAL